MSVAHVAAQIETEPYATIPAPRTADGSIATSADLEAIAAPLADRGRIASYADLLTVIIQALEAWDIEPEPRSVGPNGFTIRLQGHRVRIGFGVTMS